MDDALDGPEDDSPDAAVGEALDGDADDALDGMGDSRGEFGCYSYWRDRCARSRCRLH